MSRLGPLGEMLVECFPEFREHVADMVADDDAFLDGLGEDEESIANHELSSYELASDFRTELLAPAIDAYPDSAAELQRYIDFMIRFFHRFPDRNKMSHEALRIRAIDHLTLDQKLTLRRVAPELSDEIWIADS